MRIESGSAFLCDFLGELLAFDGSSDGVVGRSRRVRRVRHDRSEETSGPSSGRGRRRLVIVFAFVEGGVRHFRRERERERELSEVRTRGGFYIVVVERRILDFFNRGKIFFFVLFIYLFIKALFVYGRKLWFFDCSLVDKTIYSQWVLMALYHWFKEFIVCFY